MTLYVNDTIAGCRAFGLIYLTDADACLRSSTTKVSAPIMSPDSIQYSSVLPFNKKAVAMMAIAQTSDHTMADVRSFLELGFILGILARPRSAAFALNAAGSAFSGQPVEVQNGETHFLLPRKRISRSTPTKIRISYLWPECVTRKRRSRRLSGTVEARNSARSAGVHLLIVALMAAAHLSMLSALG
jgi:hypothetical protein